MADLIDNTIEISSAVIVFALVFLGIAAVIFDSVLASNSYPELPSMFSTVTDYVVVIGAVAVLLGFIYLVRE